MIWLKRGSQGREVVDVQTRLLRLGYELGLTGVDGVFGPETERAVRLFQEKREREADGIVGPDTWREMVDAGFALGDRQLYLMEPPLSGDDVREMQATLNNVGFNAGRVSGVLGEQTDKAVRDFQRNVGLDADGIVGETTVQALDNFRMRVSSGGITGVWDRAVMQPAGALAERRIAIDHAADDFSRGIAEELAVMLKEEGAIPLALPETSPGSDERELATLANEQVADVLLRLETAVSEEPGVRGSVCEFFDNGEFFSARSKNLANLIENEVSAALRVFDNGVEGKNLAILQATRMPAVVIKPVVESDPRDAEIMARPGAAAAAAGAIVTALGRYWQE
jgi:N-acetylmuramoyl-L-alanine amidase